MRFCHMDNEWCWVKEDLETSQEHRQDPQNGLLCACVRACLCLCACMREQVCVVLDPET